MIDLYKLSQAEFEIKKFFPIPVMYRDILGLPGDLEKGSVCCPFHGERTPSFSYTPAYKDGLWSCFGACSKKGDTIDLYRFYVEKKEGRKISRAFAVKQLMQIPAIRRTISVKDIDAEPLKFDSFEKMLFHEYRTKHTNLSDSELEISRSIQDLNKEKNDKNFVKMYDDLLKINWKGTDN